MNNLSNRKSLILSTLLNHSFQECVNILLLYRGTTLPTTTVVGSR